MDEEGLLADTTDKERHRIDRSRPVEQTLPKRNRLETSEYSNKKSRVEEQTKRSRNIDENKIESGVSGK